MPPAVQYQKFLSEMDPTAKQDKPQYKIPQELIMQDSASSRGKDKPQYKIPQELIIQDSASSRGKMKE